MAPPKKQKPTLTQRGRRTKVELAEARELADTGIFDNEEEFELAGLQTQNIVTIVPLTGTKPKGLPDCIKNYLVKRFGQDKNLVDKATYTRSDPIALKFTYYGAAGVFSGSASYTYNFSNTGAFTWGNNIDFLDSEFNESDGISDGEVALAGHEFFHVLQYANDPNFTAKYLLNFVANLADAALFKPLVDIYAGGISGEAYRNINYEKKANEFEGQIEKDINTNGNPCNPNSVNGKKYGR